MKKRAIYSILAGLVALSLIISGVWAWIDNSQHKSNIATGGKDITFNDVVLVEDYEETDDWKQEDELTKKVSVLNKGDGPIYVRIQLKEYMDIAHVSYDYHEGYYLVDTDGQFVTADSLADMKAWLAENMPGYDEDQIVQLEAYGVTGKRYYYRTDKDTTLNGKYGKQLLEDFTQQTVPTPLIDDAQRGSYQETDDNQAHPTDECKYNPHIWSALGGCENCGQGDDGTGEIVDDEQQPGLGFHDYVEWKMGEVPSEDDPTMKEDAFILLSEWDGEPVAKWILDDTSAAKGQGWAYWGEALEAKQETAYLLESITLKLQPSGPFYYAIHVDMNAADIYQLKANFKGIPRKIAKSYGLDVGEFAISADKTTVKRNGKVALTATWNGERIDPAEVEWTFESLTAGINVGPNTKINDTSTGILTIGGGQGYCTIRATATYDSPEGLVTESLEFAVVA